MRNHLHSLFLKCHWLTIAGDLDFLLCTGSSWLLVAVVCAYHVRLYHYAELGMHLLDDRNGDTIASQEEQFQRNPVKIATAVYKNWISGTGRKPISWRTLLGVLRDIELNSLAEEIETALKHLNVQHCVYSCISAPCIKIRYTGVCTTLCVYMQHSICCAKRIKLNCLATECNVL